ncbi:helix-turn-helix domain-containing protein [Mesorhizobium silamurunense]|uniref:helix-turn-helix domain-containing protein n=1 Tax=Mesorhizobium silamurunense TaxID=499528 RepID=UPI001782B07F|nr:helix-turn-helix domain-containing protein [Mesorhizobium silamurunense]
MSKKATESLPALLRTRGVPEWVRQIVKEAAAEFGVAAVHIYTKSRKADVCLARYASIYRVKEKKRRLSSGQIGKWFDRNHTSVFFSLARHAQITGRPALTSYDLSGRPIKQPNRKGKGR